MAPITQPWAQGQYVESVTRGVVEIATLPLAALKSGKIAKAGNAASDIATVSKTANGAADANKVAHIGDATKLPEPHKPNGDGGKILQTNHQKAAFGEKVAHQKMVDDGFEPLGNTDGKYKAGETGIDGIYRNPNPPPDYVITEVKYNKARLGTTKDGKQLSDTWVTGNKRLENAGLSQTDVDAIKRGLRRSDGTVEKYLIKVKPDGTTKTSKID